MMASGWRVKLAAKDGLRWSDARCSRLAWNPSPVDLEREDRHRHVVTCQQPLWFTFSHGILCICVIVG